MASPADLATLAEGQTLEDVPLSRHQATALNASRLVSVQPSTNGWRVTAAHAVGALRVGELVVRVTPKVGAVQVLTLLARAQGVRKLDIDPSRLGLADDADLTTVLAVLFAREAESAMSDGPLRGYRVEEQTLPVLRGRLRLREQETRRFGLLQPLEVIVDEWTLDTDDNRHLLAAVRRLLLLPGVPDFDRRRLLHADRQLTGVREPVPGQATAWTATRLNARLHAVLRLADLVLESIGVEHRVGDVISRGFVLNLAWLFEALITRLLQERADGVRVVAQSRWPLDTLNRLAVQPDIMVRSGLTVIAVADTKYKLLNDAGRFPEADAYQLLTYAKRLGVDEAHLIYAAGEPQPEPYQLLGAGVTLHIHAVPLDVPVTQIETAVDGLMAALTARAATSTV